MYRLLFYLNPFSTFIYFVLPVFRGSYFVANCSCSLVITTDHGILIKSHEFTSVNILTYIIPMYYDNLHQKFHLTKYAIFKISFFFYLYKFCYLKTYYLDILFALSLYNTALVSLSYHNIIIIYRM